jgi:multimeric flavodoxin WrbA
MNSPLARREFLTATAAATLATTATTVLGADAEAASPLKLLGISCSPRRGMTTARAVQAALDAATAVSPRIRTELIDLGGLSIAPWSPQPPADDMAALLPKFRDPALAGLIIGSPCYFRTLSGLAKCFLERLAPLREPVMVLADKPFGVVTVGAFRNGGQELTIQEIQAILLCFGMIPVGGHAPAFQGATLLSANDSVAHDELGLRTASQVGKRVAEFGLRLAPAAQR